jgi:hypothetical protein
MGAGCRVVLDAGVLIPMPPADSLLRMAEAPRFHLPKRSQIIMEEVTRNLVTKWGLAPEKARRRELELRRSFSEAWEIEVQGPPTFLRGLYDLNAGLLAGKLHEQAATIGVSLPRLPLNLARNGQPL